jgi:hypothetical protein
MIRRFPQQFRWTGSAFEPRDAGALAKCQVYYKADCEYRIAEVERESEVARSRYFAMVQAGWRNTPETFSGWWPTQDVFRYWCLTHTQFRETVIWELFKEDDKQGFRRASSEMRRHAALRGQHLEQRYYRVEESGGALLQHFALTQRPGAMSASEFYTSTEEVIHVICRLLGVTEEQLEAMSKVAA